MAIIAYISSAIFSLLLLLHEDDARTIILLAPRQSRCPATNTLLSYCKRLRTEQQEHSWIMNQLPKLLTVSVECMRGSLRSSILPTETLPMILQISTISLMVLWT